MAPRIRKTELAKYKLRALQNGKSRISLRIEVWLVNKGIIFRIFL